MEVEQRTGWHVFVKVFHIVGHVINSHVFAIEKVWHHDDSIDLDTFGMLSLSKSITTTTTKITKIIKKSLNQMTTATQRQYSSTTV